MGNVVVSMFAFIGAFIIAFFILAIIMYVFMGIFLGKLNKIMYGKKTPMAWIPVLNTYLMGKLAFNKIVGIILVILPVIIMFIPNIDFSNKSTEVQNGVTITQTTSISLNTILLLVYSLVCLIIFVMTVVKYFKLKKNRVQKIETPEPENTITPPVGTPMEVTPQTNVTSNQNIAESFSVPDSLSQPVQNDQINAQPISAEEIKNIESVQGTPQTPGLETISIESNVPSNVFQSSNAPKQETNTAELVSQPETSQTSSETPDSVNEKAVQTNPESNNSTTIIFDAPAAPVNPVSQTPQTVSNNQVNSELITQTVTNNQVTSETVTPTVTNNQTNTNPIPEPNNNKPNSTITGEPFDIFSSKPIDVSNDKNN